MRSLTTFAFSFVLLAPLPAQDVSFSGKVEDGEGVCYYCPGFAHVLDFTHTSLTSSALNLDPFIGQYVTGAGHWNGSTTSPAIDVTSLTVTTESFTIGGGGSIGKKISFTAKGTPGDAAITVIALQDGFLPVPGWGTLFLNSAGMIVLGQGTVAGDGEFDIEVVLPNDPSLVGLNIFGQAALSTPGGATRLTNSDLKVVSN